MSEKQDALAVAPIRITESQSNKLTRLAAFTPTNLTEAMALAKLIASSELAPKDYKAKPGNVLIAMQLGAELGVAPMSALANISVINGRAAVWGDLALALVQTHPDYEGHKEFFEGTGDTRRAVFQIKRKGQEWHQSTFSVQDAKTAKLWQKRGSNGQDTPWITSPDRMLAMRARGFGLRDKFADALKGLRLAEEAMDMPPVTGKEAGTLDVNREIATMTASAEPNRGHGNEGMAQQPALSQVPGMDQTEKKQDAAMCSECRRMLDASKPNGGHHKLCKHAKAEPQAAQESETKAEPTKTSSTVQEGLQRLGVRIQRIEKRDKKPLRIIHVLDNNGEWQMSCWHESFYEFLDDKAGKLAIFEIS